MTSSLITTQSLSTDESNKTSLKDSVSGSSSSMKLKNGESSSSSSSNGKAIDISTFEISPVGIVRASARGIVQDAIAELEEGLFRDEDFHGMDAKERRRRTELLLDNNERILQVLYGYTGNGTGEGDSSDSDSDC